MATSIFSRKRDLLYLVYFLIHIPIVFLVDISSLYPEWMKTPLSRALIAFSEANYRDFLLVPQGREPAPAWFVLYLWMELVFHVPVSLWALGALVKDDPKVPLVLIAYASQTALTTATCIAEYLSWTNVTFREKLDLTTLYGPYLALSVFMLVDMSARLNGVINRATTSRSTPGKKTL